MSTPQANNTKNQAKQAAKEDRPEKARADPNILYRKKVDLLNRTVKDLCGRINDHPGRSLTVRIKRTAHLSLDAKKAIVARVRKSVDAFEVAVLAAPGVIADDFDLNKVTAGEVIPVREPATEKQPTTATPPAATATKA